MSPTVKKYLVSSLITFAAGFVLAILPDWDSLTLETVKSGALVGVVFSGVRAGLKALFEGFVAWYAGR